MTLKNATDASDFKLNKFQVGPQECFEPYYGVGGADGDGDILKPENLEEFKDYVLQQTGQFVFKILINSSYGKLKSCGSLYFYLNFSSVGRRWRITFCDGRWWDISSWSREYSGDFN